MSEKPIHEELEQRIQELEQAESERKRAEEKLKESEERLRILFEYAPDAYYLNDLKGNFIDGNIAAETMIGYNKEELIGKSFLKLKILPSKQILKAAKHLTKNALGQPAGPDEFTLIRKDGSRVETEIRTYPVKIKGKSLVLGIARDITFRKQAEEKLKKAHDELEKRIEERTAELVMSNQQLEAEIEERTRTGEALRKSEEKFRFLTEKIADIVWTLDRNFRTTYVSPTIEKVLGFTPEERKRQSLEEMITPESLNRVQLMFMEELQRDEEDDADPERSATIEVEYYHKDGSTVWMENRVQAIRDKVGAIVGMYGVSRDITERKRAEEALSESEEKLRSMMESMKDAVYICSPDYRIKYMNPAMINKIGRDAIDEICHKVIYNNDEKCSWCMFDQVQQGEHVESELFNPKDNKYYSTSNSPIYNTDGSISKVTIVRDVTQVKKMENQLRQTQKMEAIATLAGGIAHQFNNALSLITGNLDLLTMDYPNDESINNYVEQMRYSTHRITQLTSQLLAYARGGKYQVKIVALSDFVRDTLPLIGHTIKPSVYTETDLSRNILNVKADLTQMQMVLSAILSNASEAIEGEGRIRITCKNKMIQDERAKDFPGLKPGPYVNLEIEDDGKGMDEETKSRIFEPFFTTKFQGRGLGLAAAYGIIKNHDGWISVDSELGKGTTVRIFLPAIEAKVKEIKKQKIEPVKGTGTILVIEDEEMLMDVSRAILERLGYRVLAAQNGKEAIDIAKTFDGDIDLAILDILLPDMGGKAIYPLLMEARPKLKVIICSGYSIDGPAKEILDAGAQDFIQKPFAIAEISKKLKKVLEGE